MIPAPTPRPARSLLPPAAAAGDGPAATVFVVDDDASVRQALSSLLRSVALDCRGFASAQEFLDAPAPDGPACLVLDMRLPATSGFAVQEALALRSRRMPVIFLTGFPTIPMTVRAMKAGAAEFLTKPFTGTALLEAIERALEADRAALAGQQEDAGLRARHARLTARERQVMGLVVAGLLNKQVAAELGTSEITIKVHRRQVMTKMQARSLPDLVRMAERLAARGLA